ncbi:MAG TPA: DUF892 family protein [Candidatus Paceibacterota bacterium]|nr:DUF892 family protein [Candidatus Paceibacterota bacterium]
MATKKETYLDWLRDAHAMEETLVKVLEKQVEEVPADMGAAKQKIEEHLEATRGHAEKVAACLERNGGSVSDAKDLFGKLNAGIQGLGMSMMSDKLVKNVHTSYAAEHFEIATYSIIKAAAEEVGDVEGADMCDAIIADEEDMADWLLDQLPVVSSDYIASLES